MKIITKTLIILVICVAAIQSDCDVCQSSNNVACHKENQYSLCINGIPTEDFITCPENHVCTPDPYVCYPLPQAKPVCVRDTNLCGVCSKNKVYACINETTIAFCYGEDKPYEGADVSYCLDDTVCDIYSEHGFCTESHLSKPSCITNSVGDIDETTTEPTTTTTESSDGDIDDTTTEPTTTTTESSEATTEPTTTDTSIEEPTTPTAPSEPRDPDTICKDAASTGSYYADDPTCTTFVVCFLSGDSLTGIKKSCKAGQYFPPGAKYCSATKPDCVVLLATYQIQADCDEDFNKLCGMRMQGTIPYECDNSCSKFIDKNETQYH
ncbi:mucin-2-like [Calliphora vicina]|uniref:mucin-2-like n=1 Tax=Calliphora vicina TaxID=7373 RepID=UPI00325B050F